MCAILFKNLYLVKFGCLTFQEQFPKYNYCQNITDHMSNATVLDPDSGSIVSLSLRHQHYIGFKHFTSNMYPISGFNTQEQGLCLFLFGWKN